MAMTPMVSCTDKNDWEVDSAHNRLFGVKSSALSVDTYDDTPSKISVNFSSYDKSTEYYIIELSKDSLYDEVEMGGENSTIIGADKSITSAPVDINNLEEYTKYYMRVKAMSDSKPESKWVYYKDGDSFRTPGILHDVLEKDRLDDNIRLTWIPGSQVTALKYTYKNEEGEQEEIITLSDEDRAAGEYRVTGLNTNRQYKFELLDGEKVRGALTVKTQKGLPTADYMVVLNENRTIITQDDIDEWANAAFEKANSGENAGAATASITLGLPAGKTIELATAEKGIKIPEGISICFFGRAGEKATLKVKHEVNVEGNHGYISFEHVNIDGEYNVDEGTGCNDFINDKNAFAIDSLGITECEVKNFKQSVIRFQGSTGQTLKNLTIDNCIIHDVAQQGYGMIQMDKGMQQVDSINITNSTIYNGVYANKCFLSTASIKSDVKVNMESCTFYNLIGSGGYFIDNNNGGDMAFNCNKVIFAKTYNPSAKGVRNLSTVDKHVNISNTYMTNDWTLTSNKMPSSVETLSVSSSSAFQNAAGADFTLKNSILEKEKVGDPRWIR